MSDSLRPHGPYSPWNSPGQNTGVGSHSLLQSCYSPTLMKTFFQWVVSGERKCLVIFLRRFSLVRVTSCKLKICVFCLISRELNRIKHSKPGSVQMVSEKKKHIVAVVK